MPNPTTRGLAMFPFVMLHAGEPGVTAVVERATYKITKAGKDFEEWNLIAGAGRQPRRLCVKSTTNRRRRRWRTEDEARVHLRKDNEFAPRESRLQERRSDRVELASARGYAAPGQSLRDLVEQGSILMRHTSKQKWARTGPIFCLLARPTGFEPVTPAFGVRHFVSKSLN